MVGVYVCARGPCAKGAAPTGPGRLRETLNGASSDLGLSLLYQLLCINPEWWGVCRGRTEGTGGAR
jgi:hypothetical protein